MAAPTFTRNGYPFGYDQTQRRFTLYGLLGLSGNYTNATGIAIDFTNIFDASGNKLTIPPTYTGANGPGQSIPLEIRTTANTAGYGLSYDSTNHSVRLFNGTTEVATGTIPAALTAAGVPVAVTFMRG